MSWLLIALVKNAIIVVPLAVLALAASRVIRRPALGHVLWVLVLVKLLTPPLVDVPVGFRVDISNYVAASAKSHSSLSPEVGLAQKASGTAAPDPNRAAPPPDNPTAPAESVSANRSNLPVEADLAASPPRSTFPKLSQGNWLALVGLCWLSGSALTAALLLRRGLAFRRFLKLAARYDERIADRAGQLAHSVGLRTCPKVVVVDAAISPLLWGLGGRVLLVFPARLAERLKSAEVDSLLLHELAHYARGDYWVRLVELAAQIVWWWHPVVWWARQEIEAAEEQCCDAWVVKHQTGSRQSYAEALLTTIDFLSDAQPRGVLSAPLPPAVCGLGDVPLLRTRLIKIMRGQFGGQLPRGACLLVLGIGTLLSPLAPAVLATSSQGRVSLPPVKRSAASTIDFAPAPPAADALTLPSKPPVPAPAIEALPGPPVVPPPTPTAGVPVSVVFASAQSPSGRFRLQARTGGEVTLVHPSLQLGLSSNGITCAAFAPDSRTFLTGHQDGVVRQWDSETGGRLKTFRLSAEAVESVAWSPAGAAFAAGTVDGTIAVWNILDEVETARLNREGIAVSCLRWSPDGEQIAATLGAWSSTSEAGCVVWSPARGEIVLDRPLDRPGGALDWLSPGTLIVADWEGAAAILDLHDAARDRAIELEKDTVSAAHWSPDCPLVPPWQAQQLAAASE
jgi:bla regulator protein BlaR1